MSVIISILPSLIVAVTMAFFNRAQNRRDREVENRAAARKEESLLALDMQMATAKLSYATAMALKRGHANGEVEDGIASYETSKKKYFEFLNKQATEHLH